MSRLRVSIIGASGYTGGELLRLLLFHPEVELAQVTSESWVGKPVPQVHPNLRRQTTLRFSPFDELEPCDVVFTCLPHRQTLAKIDHLMELAPRVIDLSADFRLHSSQEYERWYGTTHTRPELLSQFVYGIAELHREQIAAANHVACAGCNATASILGLHPLYAAGAVQRDRTVIEVKAGTSQAGNKFSRASHHPERSGSIRVYSPAGHRHTAEIRQELGLRADEELAFTATALDMVRGVHCVAHVYLTDDLTEKDIWKLYNASYKAEPFVRVVKERTGANRYPDTRLLAGTNFCDVGFERDPSSRRLVVIAAIDNLMKGAAGQAVQAFNLMCGFDETTALTFPGLFPA